MKVLLRCIVRLFPRAFRAEFGADVLEQALADCTRAHTRGAAAGTWSGIASVLNILCAAIAEHLRPTWNTLSHSSHKGLSM